MDYVSLTDKSPVRDSNEDQYIIKRWRDILLYAVSDGIGGLSHADKASKLAVEKFNNPVSSISEVKALFQSANQSILYESKKMGKPMGSTLATCLINQKTNEAIIAYIGDSRVYLFNETIWKTKDDTLVQELIDMEIFTETQAFHHPNKSRLNQALGTSETINIHITQKPLKKEIILLCTDGLHDFVQDTEIYEIIQAHQKEKAAHLLVSKARNNGSTDDITLIIITP